jgi:hypothetical protein
MAPQGRRLLEAGPLLAATGRQLPNRRRREARCQRYAVGVREPVASVEEPNERVRAYGRTRTADDVSITRDGRRLDSKEAMLAFLAELKQERTTTMQPR